jgi:hypothetical protein
MNVLKLIDVVAQLVSYDPELTIYAAKPWTCDSEAVVAREPEDGGLPPEAAARRCEYFIEVFVAKEFLEGWIAVEGRSTSAREQCDRLIHYAVYDA